MTDDAPQYTAANFPIGVLVTFADATATVSHGEAGIARGRVNGSPVTDDEGAVTHVPVWASRDNGREATTVFVAIENVMDVS